MVKRFSASVALAAVCSAAPGLAHAQPADEAVWATHLATEYRVVPDVTYLTTNNWEGQVDLYLPRNADRPTPTVLYFHGGFWVRGNKGGSVLNVMPYLEMGWAVVNVAYRLGQVSRAPAAVEDCLCALRWVVRNAEQYNFDVSRIVTTGHSAGGHLSLTTGIVPAAAGLDRQCAGAEPLTVAAIVNWFGPTDVGDLLGGPNLRNPVVEWFGSTPDRMAIALRVSPLTYVRGDLPPILTIHGDADPVVPYQHAVRLHQALDRAGAVNQLHTVPGGGHGGFSREQTVTITDTIHQFLRARGLAGK
jgi:acetyl esterase/lipase